MAVVTVLTAARMAAIEAATVVSGVITGNNLILTKFDSSTINAGNARGPAGSAGIAGNDGPAAIAFEIGNVAGQTSAQIDALFATTPQDGRLAVGLLGTVPTLFVRRYDKWHSSSAYTQIA